MLNVKLISANTTYQEMRLVLQKTKIDLHKQQHECSRQATEIL